jgi:hypothetical protein
MLDMKRRQLLYLIPAALAACGRPASAQGGPERFVSKRAGAGVVDHGAFDRLLARYVKPGRDGVNQVAYAAWKAAPAHRAALAGYIGALERTDPLGLTRPEQFAYWANLYNAATLRVVLDRYPVKSIREIKPHPLAFGPWKTPVVKVGGAALSLDAIEHDILRKSWREPRVHYAVNCASIGCPNLRPLAFRGATLGLDLASAASAYVNHPRGARVEAGKLVVSSIYQWYKRDFGGSDSGVIAHLRANAAAPLKAQLAGITDVAKTTYDWALNDAGRA